MADLLFYAMYTTSKTGTTGLTVTIDIHRITRSSGATSEVVTGGSATELGDGIYLYRLAGANPELYDYIAIFKTATTTVDQRDIPALWTLFGMDSDGGIADPLLNTVPGSYASGSAGYALGRIGTGNITVLSPVTTDGDVTTYQGADYSVALGNPIVWTDDEDSWPAALGATDVITARVGGVQIACTLITGGTHLQIRCEPTREETALIPARKHIFQVIAVQADGDVYSPIIEAEWTSKDIEIGTAVTE